MIGWASLLQFEDNPDAGAIRLVAQVADAVELALLDQRGDLLQQGRLVDHVGDFGDDDLPAVAARLLGVRLGAQDDAAPAGGVGLEDAFATQDEAAGREVRPGDDLGQILDGGVGVVDQVDDAVAQLGEIVGRDIGRHADGDAGDSIEQQVRQPGGQDGRFVLAVVVVGPEIDRLTIDVG